MKTLFINACIREESRTFRLAQHLLNKLPGEITELDLQKENIQPLSACSLEHREKCVHSGTFDDPMLRYAHEFTEADIIVIAAPFWDFSFPASLKCYFEAITVSGITFTYADGIPQGLCKAKKLYFVSTCGGPFTEDFGYNYIKTMAQSFYGIPEVSCFKAEFLDVIGMDTEAILQKAFEEIDAAF